MTSKLISIVGIDGPFNMLLKEKGNISTLKQLAEATRTPIARRELAMKMGTTIANIANCSVQAEL
ncbi:hypothetical protein ACPWUF_00110 [Bisgaard Taxon 46]